MKFRAKSSFIAAALVIAAVVNASHAQQMSRGEYVARTANCVACHSVAGGAAFAGGLKMATPIGAIYATNITPDRETGIGAYTLDEFDRAVRRGIAKDGHHLYPAMPYPSYAKMTEGDIRALYDFFMKEVAAVKAPNPPSEIKWPMNMRWPLSIWNALFVDFDRYVPRKDKDPEWNRGAYLVQGPGHCGACHTPRGWASQEVALNDRSSSYLSGGVLDYWNAINLTADNNLGIGRWSEADVAEVLKTGRNKHTSIAGTMVEVVNNSTQFMSDSDIKAMAKYLKSLPSAMERGQVPWAYDASATDALSKRDTRAPGANTYARHCASCHGNDGRGRPSNLPTLVGNPGVVQPDPVSVINVVLNGSARVVVNGVPDAYRMPQYRLTLKDNQEVADVVNFVRNAWGNRGSKVTANDVAAVRQHTDPSSDRVVVLRMK